MKENRVEGKVTNVEHLEDGWCLIIITSNYSEELYEVKISENALELINYNLENCKKTKLDCKLLSMTANISFLEEDSSEMEMVFTEPLFCLNKMEIIFTEPMVYSICFACRSIRKI